MAAPNSDVAALMARSSRWQAEQKKLGTLLRASGLTEELKWGKPCYSFEDSNIAIIQPFKERCAVMFFKGALMKDPKGVLVAPGVNSQSGRRIEYASLKEIVAGESVLRAYVKEAIALEKSGQKIEKRATELPEELAAKLKRDPKLNAAFRALTPGRQRAYVIFITGAKQSATRTARVEKVSPRILAGKGMNDR